MIGEMILAVNKDMLVDCNYDAVSVIYCFANLTGYYRMTLFNFVG